LRARIFPNNKRSLFEVLASTAIDTVIVEFDGCGDSGQIESVTAFSAANEEIALPTTSIEMREVVFEGLTIAVTTQAPSDVVEAMACDFLEQTHSGWEDGDGAFGRQGRSRSSSTTDTSIRTTTSTSSEEVAMAHSYHHAVSSARKWGGAAEDYLAIHT
jgi:hypothetical protein